MWVSFFNEEAEEALQLRLKDKKSKDFCNRIQYSSLEMVKNI